MYPVLIFHPGGRDPLPHPLRRYGPHQTRSCLQSIFSTGDSVPDYAVKFHKWLKMFRVVRLFARPNPKPSQHMFIGFNPFRLRSRLVMKVLAALIRVTVPHGLTAVAFPICSSFSHQIRSMMFSLRFTQVRDEQETQKGSIFVFPRDD